MRFFEIIFGRGFSQISLVLLGSRYIELYYYYTLWLGRLRGT